MLRSAGVFSLAVLFAALGVAPGYAQNAATVSTIVFAGADIESRSVFAVSGGKLLYPISFATNFFVLATAGASLSDVRRHAAGKISRDAIAADARLFGGVERSFGRLFVNLGAGISLTAYQTRTGIARQRAGTAIHADLWFHVTGNDVVNATAILDSGPRSLWMRWRYGRKLLPDMALLVGPEISVARSVTTRKVRAGLHVSEIAFGQFKASVAGGWMWDRKRPGQYLSVSAYRPL